MKKYVLLILVLLLSFGIKAQEYLLTDKEQFNKYTKNNKDKTLFKNHDKKNIINYVSKSSINKEILINLIGPIGPDPGPCNPVPKIYLSIEKILDDPDPLPPCPPKNLCVDPQNLLSDKKFRFLPNATVNGVMLYDPKNKSLSSLPHQIVMQNNFSILTFDKKADTMVNGLTNFYIQFGISDSNGKKFYKINFTKCGK